MTTKRRARQNDPRQLDLFGAALPAEDPLHVYYRRLRRAGAWLTYEINTGQIFAGRINGGLPSWAVTSIAQLRDRILQDLLRVEHGISPPIAEREILDGGAVLHRLSGRRPPELDPPVRPRPQSSGIHRGPGAA